MTSEYETARPPVLVQRRRGIEFESRNPFPLVGIGERKRTSKGDFLRRKVGSEEVILVDVGKGSNHLFVVGEGREIPQQALKQPEVESHMTGTKETNPDIKDVDIDPQFASPEHTQIIHVLGPQYILIRGLHAEPLFDPRAQ